MVCLIIVSVGFRKVAAKVRIAREHNPLSSLGYLQGPAVPLFHGRSRASAITGYIEEFAVGRDKDSIEAASGYLLLLAVCLRL